VAKKPMEIIEEALHTLHITLSANRFERYQLEYVQRTCDIFSHNIAKVLRKEVIKVDTLGLAELKHD